MKNKLCFGLAVVNECPYIGIIPIRGEGGGWFELSQGTDLSDLKEKLKYMIDNNPDLNMGLIDDGIELKGKKDAI